MGVVGDRPFNEVDTRGFRTELKLVLIFSYAQKFETSPSKGRTVTKTVQYRVRNPGTAIFLRTWLVQKRLRRLERLRLPLSSYRVKAPPLSQTTRPFISIFFICISATKFKSYLTVERGSPTVIICYWFGSFFLMDDFLGCPICQNVFPGALSNLGDKKKAQAIWGDKEN